MLSSTPIQTIGCVRNPPFRACQNAQWEKKIQHDWKRPESLLTVTDNDPSCKGSRVVGSVSALMLLNVYITDFEASRMDVCLLRELMHTIIPILVSDLV